LYWLMFNPSPARVRRRHEQLKRAVLRCSVGEVLARRLTRVSAVTL
jgi:hypothetical protein